MRQGTASQTVVPYFLFTQPMRMKKMLPKTAVVVLILLGVIICRYLFYKHLNLAGPDVCSAVFGNSCNAALSGSFAEVLGLPLGGWGLLYYFILGVFFLVPWVFGKEFLTGSRFFIFVLSLCSVLAGLFYTGLMLWRPALFCPLCTLVHGINFLLFFLLIKVNGYGFSRFFNSLRIRRAASVFILAGFWKPFGFLIAGFFMVSAFFGLKALALSTAAAQKVDFKKVFADYDSQPVREIPVAKEDAVAGNSSGPMKLVIFTDFYCPACRMFSAETDSIVKKFGRACFIVFKQFPLSTECNATINKNIHAGACDAARAALAAAQQGKYMEFHDLLFNSTGKTDLVAAARKCGLRLPDFESFRNGPLASAVLQAGIRQGALLGIDGTPAVFLNGRQIKDTRPGVVQSVLIRELQSGRNTSRR
ncbi:DsbA family protein [Niabella sp. CC-SYL272]|uniref:DsbA family protein n=1 Tax=Niabella agricola TaxID=2891571 RepID=UPI001F2E8998|nr:DsbA family protein [Niabella agricola]MCF3108233.1 DsbA family protein [Niabella agricola]